MQEIKKQSQNKSLFIAVQLDDVSNEESNTDIERYIVVAFGCSTRREPITKTQAESCQPPV